MLSKLSWITVIILANTHTHDSVTEVQLHVKVYKVAVRPAMLYGLETVTLTKRQETEMEVAELKKRLRFSLGATRMDKIRNEYIRGTAQVGKFGEKTREARLRWYMDTYGGNIIVMGILGDGC